MGRLALQAQVHPTDGELLFVQQKLLRRTTSQGIHGFPELDVTYTADKSEEPRVIKVKTTKKNPILLCCLGVPNLSAVQDH